MPVPCDLCTEPALFIHGIGCGAILCAIHADDLTDCRVCGEPMELPVRV